jgi:hypothetical protein
MAKAKLEKTTIQLSPQEIKKRREEVARNILMTSEAQDFAGREQEDADRLVQEDPNPAAGDWEGTYKPLHPERRDQRRARADERRGGLPRELHAQGGGDPKVTERTWLLNDNKPGFEETSLNDLMTFVSRDEPDMKGRIVPKSRKAWGFVKDAYGAENKTRVPWHMRYFRETGLDDDEIIEEVSRIMLSEGDRPVYPSEPRISIKEVRDALQGIADSKERKPKGWWK